MTILSELSPGTDDVVLDVQNLSVCSRADAEAVQVNGVSFSIRRGEIVGMVGESGSGKTLTSLAVSQLLPTGLRMTVDRLQFAGHDLIEESSKQTRAVLGTQMAMVFQDPLASLNPARRVGAQMIEAVRQHRGFSGKDARALAVQRLDDVGIDSPEVRFRQYPHELSGGMRQRVMIAMGLMSEPSLFIADEPTTALDVTVQAQVVELLCQLNELRETAVLFISHNIALLSEVCDRIIVMYRGRVVETLSVEKLLAGPDHPYTRALVGAVPDLGTDRSRALVTIGDDDFDAASKGAIDA